MRKIATIILSLVLISGCIKTEIKNTLHPDMAEVNVEVEIPVAGDYTVVVDGVEYAVVDGAVQFPDYFAPGSYTLFAFNDASGVSMDCSDSKAVASVAVSDGVIDSDPGVLYFAKQVVDLKADEAYSLNLTMEQVTADILFELTISGDIIDDLKVDSPGGVIARLEGVSQQWDCLGDCTYGVSGYTESDMSLSQSVSISRSSSLIKLSFNGSMSLLGVDTSEAQTLTVVLNYNDGTSLTFDSDVSAKLATLNQNKSTAITLSGDFDTSVSGSIDGGVIDWVVEDNSDDVLDLY